MKRGAILENTSFSEDCPRKWFLSGLMQSADRPKEFGYLGITENKEKELVATPTNEWTKINR